MYVPAEIHNYTCLFVRLTIHFQPESDGRVAISQKRCMLCVCVLNFKAYRLGWNYNRLMHSDKSTYNIPTVRLTLVKYHPLSSLRQHQPLSHICTLYVILHRQCTQCSVSSGVAIVPHVCTYLHCTYIHKQTDTRVGICASHTHPTTNYLYFYVKNF